MKIKITNPYRGWTEAYRDVEFEVCDGYNPSHPQYPVMTRHGRTWFNEDEVTVIEE